MVLDIIAVTLIIALFIRGYRKGIIIAVFALLSLLAGIVCALKLSHLVADFLSRRNIITSAWAPVIAYILLFVLVVWIVRMGAKLIEKSADALSLGVINRMTGGILYAAIGAIIWSSVLWLANQAHLITPEAAAGSVTYRWMLPVAPRAFAYIGSVVPFCKDLFGDLEGFFDQLNRQLPQHVGIDR